MSAIDRTPIESLGLTNFSCPRNKWCSQIADEIAPKPSEIVVFKTTDSAVTGTNLRLILSTMGHKTVICAGIFTDQYVSSTVEVSRMNCLCATCRKLLRSREETLREHELQVVDWIYC